MKKLFAVILVAFICLCTFAADNYRFARNIPYRNANEPMCNLDVAYLPGGAPKPVVVWLHGGGLTGGNKEVPDALLRDSLTVVGVEYRLSPSASIDEIIDDAAAAVAWTMANISKYNGNPQKIFLSGHSAGGYLIDIVALDKSRLGKYGFDPDSLAGVVPFSGQCITHFEARNRNGIPALQPTIDELAPLYYVRGDCPPFLIISGDREKELFGRYEEQAYFWRMLKLVGHKDVTLYELDGFDHGTMVAPGFLLLINFINTHI